MLTAMLPAATAPIRHLTAAPIVSQQSTAPRPQVWNTSQQATAVVLGLLCMRSHTRPEQMPQGRRRRMLSRPKDSYSGLTGRKGKQVRFLNSPSAPGMSPGRSAAASQIRGKLKCCRSWKGVFELVNVAKKEGKLEASVFGAAMQVCGNQGWWEGLVELRQIQRKEGVTLFSVERSIALTALAHCLKLRRRQQVVPERRPVALALAGQFWREVEPATDALTFNSSLSSALKLATCVDCEGAYNWGSEVWRESEEVAFRKSHITLSAYICFLEQYQQCAAVDSLLESQDEVMSEAINVVLLSSLLNCLALRQDWQRAEALWDTFMKRQVKPNIICLSALAKVHLFTGRPREVVAICNNKIPDFVRAMRENYKVASMYAQAFLVVCHSSLDSTATHRLQAFLAQALEEGPSHPRSFKEDLRRMRQVVEKLLSEPDTVYLRDVLIEWNAKKQSVMAEWENFPAGSNYLEDPLN